MMCLCVPGILRKVSGHEARTFPHGSVLQSIRFYPCSTIWSPFAGISLSYYPSCQCCWMKRGHIIWKSTFPGSAADVPRQGGTVAHTLGRQSQFPLRLSQTTLGLSVRIHPCTKPSEKQKPHSCISHLLISFHCNCPSLFPLESIWIAKTERHIGTPFPEGYSSQ